LQFSHGVLAFSVDQDHRAIGCNILAWPNLPKSVHRLINPDGRVVEVEVICSVNMPSPREDVVVCGYGGRLNDAGGICGVR